MRKKLIEVAPHQCGVGARGKRLSGKDVSRRNINAMQSDKCLFYRDFYCDKFLRVNAIMTQS